MPAVRCYLGRILLVLVWFVFGVSHGANGASSVIGWGANWSDQTTIPSGLSNVVAIAAGGFHNLALTANGQVVGWGASNAGQINIPSGLSNVVAIAAGREHNLALRADGQVVGWGGYHWEGWTDIPSALSNVVAIAAGEYHSLALAADGHVVTWGADGGGRTNIPSGLSNVVAIAAGLFHNLALTADGQVVGWGDNSSGQTNIPSALSNVVAIAAGEYHSLALTADGQVVGWGHNYANQTSIPSGLSNVVAIGAGESHSLALTADGRVVGWGWNGYGQTTSPVGLSNVVAIAAGASHSLALIGLPAESGPPLILSPRVALATVDRFFHERIGTGTTADGYGASGLPPGLTVDRKTGWITGMPSTPGTYSVTLYATNVSGVAQRTLAFHVNLSLPGLSADFVYWNQRRGFHYRATVNSEWVTAVGLPPGLVLDAQTGVISGVPLTQGDYLVSLTAINRYGSMTGTLTIRIASPVVGWGDNRSGQTTSPGGLSNVVAIAAGGSHSLALTADGKVVPWGSITYTPEGYVNNVVAIAGGWDRNVALMADGQVVAWNSSGVSVPNEASNVVAIDAGGGYSLALALTADGRVIGWGYNDDGQIPSGLSNVVAIAAGEGHSLALMAGGLVVGWGDNSSGQTTIPSGLSNVTAIAAGQYHSLALTADGRVVGWGDNYYNQTTIPSGLSNVVAIAAGSQHSLALTVDGQVIGWGGEFDQTKIPSGLSNVVAIAAGEYHSLALIGLPAQSGPPLILSPQVALATVDRFFHERIVTGTKADGYRANGLPPGLTVNPVTGLITGIPSGPGMYSVTLYATNVSGVAERTVTFHVNLLLPGLSADFVSWNQGRGFYYRATVNSEWANAVGLPPGLALDARTGVISGVPLSQGDYLVSLTASNRCGSITGTLTIRIASPIVGWGWDGGYGQTTSPVGLSNVVAIATGERHSLALTAEGKVVGWGEFYASQATFPSGLSNVVAIAAGGTHSLALTIGGQVVGWGYNYSGQTNVPVGLSNVVAIAAGALHSLALTADGQVVGWGEYFDGVPSGLSNVVAIAAGEYHSLALTADGQVVGWGDNSSGQTTIPSGLSNVVAIAAGEYHSLALTAQGQVVSWGYSDEGQATILSGLSNVVAIAAGGSHSLALTADGQVVGWGNNVDGVPGGLSNVVAIAAGEYHSLALIGLPAQSGPPRIISPRVALATVDCFFHERIVTGATADGYGASGLPPGLVVDRRTGLITGTPSASGTYSVTLYATNVSGVAQRTLAFHVNLSLPGLSDDFVYWNQRRGFHYRATVNSEWVSAVGLPPGLVLDAQTGVISGVPLTQGDYLVSLTASNGYGSMTGTLTIRIASPIVGWGASQYSETMSPVGLSNVVAIAAGGIHSLALTAEGQVVSWDDNGSVQTNMPSGLSNVVEITSGLNHSLALTADGRVVGWGYNDGGQTPSGLSNVVAIAAGESHSLALTADGRVVGWGWNSYGQTTSPVGLSNVVAIAAGGSHSLALTAEGRVVGWGWNGYGQTTSPVALSNVVAIAAGASHSLALTAEGQVVSWGDNDYRQTTIPSGLSNVVGIAAGAYHSLALTANGQVVGWGEDPYRQTTIPSGLSNVVAITSGRYHSLALIGLSEEVGSRHIIATVDRFFLERVFTGTTAGGYGASGLPPGLTVDPRTGSIAGVPSAPGTYSVTLYPSNVSGVAERRLTLHVNLPLPGLSGDYVFWSPGEEFYYRATVNSEWASAVGLPPGLVLDEQSGVISGVPSRPGDYRVSLTASNRYGSVTGTLTIRIVTGTLIASPIVGWGDNRSGQINFPNALSNVVAIAAGWAHNVALTADGEVIGWGSNNYGQTNIPSWLRNVVASAAGSQHSLALTAEGNVSVWGNQDEDDRISLGYRRDVVAIAAGYGFGLALTADGQVFGSGDNFDGVPNGLSNVVAIAAGGNHSLVLTADSQVVGFGDNDRGQITIPSALSNVVAIAAGGYHSLALTAEGRVVGWGWNDYGQTNIPGGLSNVVAIATGGSHSLALTADGRVVSWGANYSGQTNIPGGLSNVVAIAAGGSHSLALIGLPAESGPPLILSPRVALATVDRSFQERIVTGAKADGYGASGLPPGLAVDTTTGLITGIPSAPGTYSVTLYATNVSGVAERTLAFDVNLPLPGLPGNFVSWNQGREFYHRAAVNAEWVSAVGLPPGLALDPQTGVISGMPLWQGDYLVSLTASNRYGSVTGTLTIRIASPIVIWGDWYYQTISPVGLSNVVAIAAGPQHILVLTADGHVIGWGYSYYGQTTIPSGLSNVVAIATGGSSLALTVDGQVVGWGDHFDGVPSGLSNVVAIAAGEYHSLALKGDGQVVGFGDNDRRQTTIPGGLSNVVAIAAGALHSLALTADGRVVGWGANTDNDGDYYGQATIPSGLSNVVAIAAGALHSLALTANGQVVAWGDNDWGQTSIPPGLSNVVAIAAGSRSLALTTEGQVIGWGQSQTTISSGLSNVVAIAAGRNHNAALIGLPGESVPPRPVRGPGYLALTVQPVSRTAIDGDNLELVVMAVGQGVVSYQWQRDGVDMPGATSHRLPILNAQPEDSGDYRVIVSNALGAVTSRVARLTILLRPRLQPLPPKVFTGVGSNVTFTANATGTPPLRYQWRKNGANIPGATNATLTIPNAQISDGGSYTVVVANDVGVANSDPLLLIVLVPAQPPGDDFVQRVAISGLTNSVGATNFFATKEPGEPNHGGKPGGKSVWYTWRAPTNGIAVFRTSGSTFDTLLGIYTNNLSLNPQAIISNLVTVATDEDRGGFYTSEARFNAVAGVDYQIAVDGFAGAAGDFVLSWELEPTSEALPVITNQPIGRVVVPGSIVTLMVGATGPNPTYQWLFNGALINGANTASLTLNNVQRADVGFYSVQVRNNFGRQVESLPATLELGATAGQRLSEDKLEDLFNPPGPPGNGGGPFQAAAIGSFLVSLGSIDYRVVNNISSATQQREPAHCGTIGNATRWLLLRPESDGTFVIDTHGSVDTNGNGLSTVLAVYTTGANAFDFPQVTCDEDGGAEGSRVRFSAEANRDYLVVADGADYAKGLIQLNWQFGVPPPVVTNPFRRHQVRPGGSVLLQAPTTNGIPPPRFQWFWNGRALLHQTNAWLWLDQLANTNSGFYTVEIDNGIGAVTQTTQVEVAEPIRLAVEPQLSQGLLRLHLPPVTNVPAGDGEVSLGVMLETTSDIGDPFSWQPVYLHTNQAAAMLWEAPATNGLQFFRARRWP